MARGTELKIAVALSLAALVFLSGCTLPAGTTITFPAERCGDGECGLCENSPQDPSCGPTAHFCYVDCGQCSDADAGSAPLYYEQGSSGLDYYEAGTATYQTGPDYMDWSSITDSCSPDGNTLIEALCYKNEAITTTYNCKQGCTAGRCAEAGMEITEFCAYKGDANTTSLARPIWKPTCSPVDEKHYICDYTKPAKQSTLYKDFLVGENAIYVPLWDANNWNVGDYLYIGSDYNTFMQWIYTYREGGEAAATTAFTITGIRSPFSLNGADVDMVTFNYANMFGVLPAGTNVETRTKLDWKFIEDCAEMGGTCENDFCVIKGLMS